jgi:hypothetical protein
MKPNLTILFLIFLLPVFSQKGEFRSLEILGENPWEPKIYGENPWLNETYSENPWEINFNEENPWGNAYNKERNLAKIEKDSLSTENINPENNLSNNLLSNSSLKDIRYEGYSNFKGTNSFWSGFLYGFILNFYGIVPGAITVAIPSNNEYIAENEFRRKYKNPTENQVKYYKKGIKNKRITKTISGVAVGALSQIGFIIILILMSF